MQHGHPPLRTSLAGLSAGKAMFSPLHPGAHPHFWSRAFSRRNFLAGAVGAAGLAIAPNLAFPTPADAAGTAPGLFCSPSPSPITGGTELLGPGTELFHVFLPAPGSEVSTVGNFKGSVGLASGHGTGTMNGDTPVTFANDTRFMTGTYVGQDGKQRKGTFAFVWLDLFSSLDGSQINDFQYGITSSGLFWTAFIPGDAVSVNMGQSTARLCLTDSFVIDAHDVVSGLTRQPADQASISLVVHWDTPGDGGHVHDETNLFDLTYVNTSSRIEWSATKQGFTFVSDSSDTSVSDLSVLGTERNGVFF